CSVVTDNPEASSETRTMGQSYRQLIAWQKSIDFVMDVYQVTKAFPRDELYGLATQLRRAAVAVPTNIADGQARFSPNEFFYFLALGAGVMLATAIIEIFPASLELRGKNAAFLVLVGYLIIHFFEHTVTPHFHFGEETHQDEFVQGHKGYSVLIGLVIHTFFD